MVQSRENYSGRAMHAGPSTKDDHSSHLKVTAQYDDFFENELYGLVSSGNTIFDPTNTEFDLISVLA